MPIEIEKIVTKEVEKIVYREPEQTEIQFNTSKMQRSARKSQRSAPPPEPAPEEEESEEEAPVMVIKNQQTARAVRSAPITPLPPPPEQNSELMGDATINHDDEVLYTNTSYETIAGAQKGLHQACSGKAYLPSDMNVMILW